MNLYSVVQKMKMENKSIYDIPLKVTFYARVSTHRIEQETSIENQIEYFKEFIKENPNWEYVEGYVDIVRGESAENRKDFQRMISDGENGVFDLILTKEISRFARNTLDSLTYTRQLLNAGVGVYFQNDNLCTIEPDSELRLAIMSSIAQDEVRKMSDRIHWGNKRSIESGKVLGNSRIFGYDKQECRLVINESEAEMVRMIFELYSTGDHSTRNIERVLYDKGYRNRNGKRINHNTISGIIQNPKYKGYYCGNKVRVSDYRTKKQTFLPKEEWVLYKDETGMIVPAIVSEELWDKCNILFEQRSNAIKSREHSFKGKSVFTGKIWCSAHKKPYWRTSYSNSVSKGEPIYQWVCGEKRKHGADECSSFAIMESELYVILSDFFKDAADNIEDYVETFLRAYKETENDNSYAKKIAELKKCYEKEEKKAAKLLDLYTDDCIDKADFVKRNDEIRANLTDIENDIAALEAKNEDDKNYSERLRRIETYFRDMYSPDTDMTAEQVDAMTQAIVDRIDVVPINEQSMRLEIKLNMGGCEPVTYVRPGKRYGRRSGNISKKMIDAYKTGNSAQ